MKRSNYLFIVLIVLLTITFSCEKDQIENENFVGTYIGEDTNSWGGWSTAGFDISESSKGDSYVNILGLCRYAEHNIEAQISGNTLSFPSQTFHVEGTSISGVHWDYTAEYFGSAVLDASKNEIIFTYTEKQIFTDTTFVCQWITKGKRQ